MPTTKSAAPQSPTAPKKRTVNYLNNKDLLKQVIESKKNNKMTDELAKMLTLLCLKYSKRANFANYSYIEDMRSFGMMMVVRTWHKFDPARSSNPFAYFTECLKKSFIQYLNQERKQRDIRDVLMLDAGLNPSHTFLNSESEGGDGGSDYVEY